MENYNQLFEHKPKEYNTVGKVLNILEGIAFAFVLLGLVFKLLHWAGGSIFMVVFLSLLSMLYFSLSIAYAGISAKFPKGIDKTLRIVCSMMLSIGCIGILFSLQQWPFGKMHVYLALFFWVPTAIVALLGALKVINIVPAATKWVLTRVVIFGLPLWLVALSSPLQFYSMIGPFRNNPKYMELYVQCREQRIEAACDEMFEFHKAYRQSDIEKQRRMENGEWID